MSTFTSTLPARPAYQGTPDTAARAAGKPRKQRGFFARLYAGLIKARHRQAALELQRHGWLLPTELEQAGWKVSERNEDSLPFVR
jgi:hypothetical protein